MWTGNEICEIGSSSYRVQYAPFRDENREVGGIIIVFQDVTEQQRLDNMRREFVANVTHELKTPKTNIKTYTETIIQGVIEDREMTTKFLNVVYGECDRMNRIVSDLLQLSQMDYDQKKWNFRKIDLDELLEDVHLKMQISAKDKSHSLKYFVQSGVGEVLGDRDAIEQVILNIVSNAIKYTPEAGEINIQAYTRDHRACIEIEDNGMGIPEKDVPRIFERFYRVDKARSREMGGTGLGLSIAKQILDEHQGDIELESTYGEGTTVRILLPYA
jgi:two-component system sensor histidine kinase VicK